VCFPIYCLIDSNPVSLLLLTAAGASGYHSPTTCTSRTPLYIHRPDLGCQWHKMPPLLWWLLTTSCSQPPLTRATSWKTPACHLRTSQDLVAAARSSTQIPSPLPHPAERNLSASLMLFYFCTAHHIATTYV